MFSERLMWIFGGGFILFGSPLFFVSDYWWAHLWGGLAILFLGGFAGAFAFNGVQNGEIKIHSSVIRRANQPNTFWAMVAIVATAGVVVIASVIWMLFFKIHAGA